MLDALKRRRLSRMKRVKFEGSFADERVRETDVFSTKPSEHRPK
jgi:hypothetical protein